MAGMAARHGPAADHGAGHGGPARARPRRAKGLFTSPDEPLRDSELGRSLGDADGGRLALMALLRLTRSSLASTPSSGRSEMFDTIRAAVFSWLEHSS